MSKCICIRDFSYTLDHVGFIKGEIYRYYPTYKYNDDYYNVFLNEDIRFGGLSISCHVLKAHFMDINEYRESRINQIIENE